MVLTLAMFGLSFHYSEIVHGPIYVGDPNYGKAQAARPIRELRMASEAIRELAKQDDAIYPAGRMAEMTFVAQHRRDFEGIVLPRERLEVSSLWHSSLTRLYRRTSRPVEMWFPGGKLSKASDRLEWRERLAD
ncbi:MAG: hypothetical protein FJ290_25860 [Planctomycetes bacterium]|nr:hypothetical protein [Planctomycetota bacterium]